MLKLELYYNDGEEEHRVAQSHTLVLREFEEYGSHICFRGDTVPKLIGAIKDYYPTNTVDRVEEVLKKYLNEYVSLNGKAIDYVMLREHTEEDEPILSEEEFVGRINTLLNSRALDFILN